MQMQDEKLFLTFFSLKKNYKVIPQCNSSVYTTYTCYTKKKK